MLLIVLTPKTTYPLMVLGSDGGQSSRGSSRARPLIVTVRKAVVFFVFFSLKSMFHWCYCSCIVVCVHSSGPHVYIQRLFPHSELLLCSPAVFFPFSSGSFFPFYV